MYPTLNTKLFSIHNHSCNNSIKKTSNKSLKSLKQSRNFISSNNKLFLNKNQSTNISTLLSGLSSKSIIINKSKSEYNSSKIINKRFNNSNFSNKSNKLNPIKRNFYSNIFSKSQNQINIIKKNNNSNNKNDLLLITSLYVLPSLKKRKRLSNVRLHKQLSVSGLSNNISLNSSSILSNKDLNRSFSSFNNNKDNNSVISSKIKDTKSMIENNPNVAYSNLASYMKERFYSDIDRKYNRRLKDDAFIHDHSIKDKIIKMRKVGIFWNRVLEYCAPIIYGQKYKYQRSGMINRKKLKYSKKNENDIILPFFNNNC